MTTYFPGKGDIQKRWFLIDAEDKTLGRLSSEVAKLLRGKHKVTYTPHTDTGDFVIVINAEKIRVTGNKLRDKFYYRHTNYPGGLKSISLMKLLDEKPEELIRHAVRGMLPKTPLGRRMLKKLKVYRGEEHRHRAQKPVLLNIE